MTVSDFHDDWKRDNNHTSPIVIEIKEKAENQTMTCIFPYVTPEELKETKIPNTLGECADMLMNIKLDRARLSRQDDELKSYAGSLKDYILECLEKEGLTSSSGVSGCVTIGHKNRFSVSDKEVFLNHVIQTKGYDLIGQSVSAAAMKERVMEGEDVPGVKCFEQTLINLTKRKV